MPHRRILVVVVDGLRASALGAYGNTTYATPAFDRFAAESLLFDNCYAPAPELAAIYQSLWRSVDLPINAPAAGAQSLPDLLRHAEIESVLISDSSEVLSLSDAEQFSRRIELAGEVANARAQEISGTAIAKLFAAAADELEVSRNGGQKLVWLHSRGMYGPWDAPLELQSELFDEDDPPPVESVEPPDLSVGGSDDPDAAFRYGCGYAGQVMALDACWSALVDSIEASGDEWLVMLLGARGYSLGEHGRIGGVDSRLYAEQLHVPWLLRTPNGNGRLVRVSQLVSPADVLPTIADYLHAPTNSGWHGLSAWPLRESSQLPWRQELVAVSGEGQVAIRTAEWCWRQEGVAGEMPADSIASAEGGELFVRPDDRWEANDVAKLCPEEVSEMGERVKEVLRNEKA